MLIKRRHVASNAADHPRVELLEEGGLLKCTLSGPWTTRTIGAVDRQMRAIEMKRPPRLEIDLTHVGRMDTAGAWVVERLVSASRTAGAHVRVIGQDDAGSTLMEAVEPATKPDDTPPPTQPFFLIRFLEQLNLCLLKKPIICLLAKRAWIALFAVLQNLSASIAMVISGIKAELTWI